MFRWLRIINSVSKLVETAADVSRDGKLTKDETEKILTATWEVIDAYEGKK